MTRQPRNISAKPPDDFGLDYARLRARAISLTQKMSGDLWTDYNASDPGVTILEQLCYALTDLSYRSGMPVEDLMGDPRTGRIALRQAGLFPPRAILPCAPVTQSDWRRLILDRVSGIGNVWLTPCPAENVGGLSGLYDISLLVPSLNPCCEDNLNCADMLSEKVLDVFRAQRNLCEDVHRIVVLQPMAVTIHAAVQIERGADVNVVLARLLFRLALTLAPEPMRASVCRSAKMQSTTAEMFDGPLLLRGFIPLAQLGPLPAGMPVDVLRIVAAETAGVTTVDDFSIGQMHNSPSLRSGSVVPVPEGHYLWLRTKPRNGMFSVRLYRDGVECHPDPVRVSWALDELWMVRRKTYPLIREYAAGFPSVSGRKMDVSSYTSVQDQFPDAYGVGVAGLPSRSSAARRGLAKQLKGYLMVFDQMMANFCAQLGFLRSLFSVSAGGDRTYAEQSLMRIVTGAETLLSKEYTQGLRALVAASDPVTSRQGSIIEFLLSIYAERRPDETGKTGTHRQSRRLSATRLRVGQEILRRLPRYGSARGCGFDYRNAARSARATELERRCCLELDVIDAACEIPYRDPIMISDPTQVSVGRLASAALQRKIARDFSALECWACDSCSNETAKTSPLAGRYVTEALLQALSTPSTYRVGMPEGDGTVRLVCHARDSRWWNLGTYTDVDAATQAASTLMRAARQPRRSVHLIEHCLLRAGRTENEDGGKYAFRVTAVVPVTRAELTHAHWRSEADAMFRRFVPAHIVVECLYLENSAYRQFLARHLIWREALHSQDAALLAETSRNLRNFLYAVETFHERD